MITGAKRETDVHYDFTKLVEEFGGLGIAKSPDQDGRYVVVDDDAKRLPVLVRL